MANRSYQTTIIMYLYEYAYAQIIAQSILTQSTKPHTPIYLTRRMIKKKSHSRYLCMNVECSYVCGCVYMFRDFDNFEILCK